jgi:hypothetical protein
MAQETPHEFQQPRPRCFFCASGDVRLSETVGILDVLFRALRRVPIRCRACQKRSYTGQDKVLPELAALKERNLAVPQAH